MSFPNYPIYAVHRTGYTIEYATPEATRAISRGRIGAKHRQAYANYEGRITVHNAAEWILRDALGYVVLASDLPNPVARRLFWERAHQAAIDARENGLPIPGTGRVRGRRRYRSGGLSHSDYVAAATHKNDLEDEGLHKLRVGRSRGIRLLCWEDAELRHFEKCWKHHRKHQWVDRRADAGAANIPGAAR